MSRLNDEQQQALIALQTGSVVVLAGPGSGKTHTLVAAVQSLLSEPAAVKVLCLTFTTKAAEKLRIQLGSHKKLFVGTFHALAAQILKAANGAELHIATDQELLPLLTELKSRLSPDANVRELSLVISRYKNGSLDSTTAQKLVKAYDAALAKRGLIDYDDLILHCLEKAASSEAYDYIFVDEFQDTSPRQYELLQRLSDSQTKLFVIGDPQQSIYRFRGADGSVFQRIQADIGPRLIHLQDNYRSTDSIVKAANKIFPGQANQQAMRQETGLVRIIETLDEYSEPAYVLRVIEHAFGGTEWHRTHHDQRWLVAESFQDFAVLYRTRRQGELLARKLRSAGLPVQCLGEDSPYASTPVQFLKTVIDYTLHPSEATWIRVENAARLARLSVRQSTFDAIDLSVPPYALVRTLAKNLDLQDDDGVLQFENLATQFSDLKTLLSYVDDITSQGFFGWRADAVCLSTIHASKGLEFGHVFVAGCNEGVLPNIRATEPDELAEERRLFYVAVTRARDSLILLHRRRQGDQAARPSLFLKLLQLGSQIDDGLAASERQRQKSRQKRAQQRLL
jgi:superfamily I DNA/RNA helicase